MRIGIDARILDRGMTGTGRYLLNILNELPNVDKNNEYFVFSGNIPDIDKIFFKIVTQKQSVLSLKIFAPIWLNIILPKMIRKYKIDLLFSPNILIPLVKLPNTKIISVVHDIMPKVYKEYYPIIYKIYLSIFLPPSLKKSSRIITVSELSKNDITKYYGISNTKIRVIYNNAPDRFKPRELSNEERIKFKKDNNFPGKYLLFVGVIQKRKNIIGLLKILDILKKKGSKLDLVMIGKPGYDFKNIQLEISKRKDIINYIEFIDDEKLALIYNNAFAFIFPSFYEGFGIPLLEAMQSGIPVLSSNTSSLIEVVGDGGILRDPQDYEGFAGDILKLENESVFYNEMKLKALKQSKKFNLNETVQRLVNVFNEL